MKRKTKLGLAGVVLLASFCFGYNSSKGMAQAEAELRKYPSYVEAVRLEDINSRLIDAKLQLEHKVPSAAGSPKGPIVIISAERLSDCGEARTIIERILTQLGDKGSIDDKLKEVYNSLPHQDDLIEYNGKPVNKSTFRNQRNLINNVVKDISIIKDQYMDNVPADQKLKKNKNLAGFIASLLSVVGAVGYAVYV